MGTHMVGLVHGSSGSESENFNLDFLDSNESQTTITWPEDTI